MKKKKWWLNLCASMAPINPDFSNYMQRAREQKAEKTGSSDGRRGMGFLPAPHKLNHMKGKKIFLGLRVNAQPSAYDLRKLGRVTSVKDQGPAGTCWIFATYGSMESCLMPEEKLDFSENNMRNVLSNICPQGYDRNSDGGGNEFMSTAYLTRWSGPALESQDPYDPYSGGTCIEFSPNKLLQKVVYIPARRSPLDNSNIKQAIMDFGAVDSSFYYDDGFYNAKTFAYYSDSPLYANHAICLVGWNDNFNKNRFFTAPPGDGAFIAQNSWGTGWGDKGYFYISYYDALIGDSNALFNKAVNPQTAAYDAVYQYDPLGWVTSIGYKGTSAWFANIYTAKSRQELWAASWYAASPASLYNLYVYTNPGDSDPTSGQLVKSMGGNISDPSYYLKAFSSPVNLTAGQRFALVVKMTTPDYSYPVPAQVPVPGYSSKASSQAGQSFISDNGKSWQDITRVWDNASVCLKAFAKNIISK